MLRRDILRNGLAVACAMATGAGAVSSLANAAAGELKPAHRASIRLAGALRSIGSEFCVDAAQRLETNGRNNGDISLHLRRAGLSGPDAAVIGRALGALTTAEAATLVSFSLSYNSGIGDAGIAAIAPALPVPLAELGLVGCGIGDRGGEALLHWAQNASGLRVICVEDNQFSEHIKTRFADLARTNKNLLVVV